MQLVQPGVAVGCSCGRSNRRRCLDVSCQGWVGEARVCVSRIHEGCEDSALKIVGAWSLASMEQDCDTGRPRPQAAEAVFTRRTTCDKCL
jgi:hypothetical protein